MLIVVALGGNALLQRGDPPDISIQRRNLRNASLAIAEIAQVHDLVITHGNGPQIGYLALQEMGSGKAQSQLDVLGAETEGMIGYLIDQELSRTLPDREIVTLVTQTLVDRHDPAFAHPMKPIGPIYSRTETDQLAIAHGWSFAPDGEHFRRVVPSPEPVRILELPAIRHLVKARCIVIAAGGGGIPVVTEEDGSVRGVEAVIDKDLASALLAHQLGAEALLLLTDVTTVQRDWGTPNATPIGEISPKELRTLSFAAGSMGPKVDAACRFVEQGGLMAGIGALEDAAKILARTAGTVVRL